MGESAPCSHSETQADDGLAIFNNGFLGHLGCQHPDRTQRKTDRFIGGRLGLEECSHFHSHPSGQHLGTWPYPTERLRNIVHMQALGNRVESEKWIIKLPQGPFGGDEYVFYLDCGHDFTGFIHMAKLIKSYTLISMTYCTSTNLQKYNGEAVSLEEKESLLWTASKSFS